MVAMEKQSSELEIEGQIVSSVTPDLNPYKNSIYSGYNKYPPSLLYHAVY